jgi:hypothetical protein
MKKIKIILDLGHLGSIESGSFDEVDVESVGGIQFKNINELTDLNAYAAQSGCSACSASGSSFCC